jgi:myo-inositol 2-dehydrogenase/D-chiro-inositol 1-dehydrogenase
MSDRGVVRLGIVGCGAIAVSVHLRNARRMPGVTVTAVADPSRDARVAAARLAPAAVQLPSAEDVVGRADVDAVVVTTPSATHTEVALATLAAGKHLYLEKPVGVSESDAERLAALAADARRVVAVGFNRRFHPAVAAARRRLARGELGRVVSVNTTFEEPMAEGTMPVWKRRRATGGGAPLDLASHHVDLARHLLGTELRAVGAVLRSVRSELDDCSLRFDAGECRVQIDCSFVRGRRDVVELVDDRGRVVRIDRYEGTLRVRGRPAWSASLLRARGRAVLRPHADPSYRPALHAFVSRVRGGSTPVPTLVDGVESLRAVLAAEALAA